MNDDALHHKRKMQKRQQLQKTIVASKTEEKGLLMVHTGTGKGKSTAAFGLLFRHLSYGFKSVVIQFIKAPEWKTGEQRMVEFFPDLLEWHTLGKGFTWNTQDKQKDIESCQAAWSLALDYLNREDISLVVLDELNIALRYNYLDPDQIIRDLQQRPKMQHVVITGRNAPQKLIDVADMVTEMKLIKHPFNAGIKAQKGIEY
ncbi:cob(I)yrinic acid a,c-diamide adenosyltransferase [Commensalibacter sp. M0357]|uniref:cob(I)yrinic acid a,c-diamide adenosyltransferase n=1 Tax=unclassified Commensalibacter TaxID=2630218 RepID=UPI0018DDACFA|nr:MULTISPECIES: cob(I)yrinic acid a,c-diamide adenosyltransferase [unclassified Commensalibacter]MBI0074688.1 cob(I)yrinic acid a,c-diamide adenosyltransferase [Commensalibacter sp. M0357]MBI0084529.1 cob(I)yrinic acid a,c-diamide adenosyltransferase [Commensalibacter sp. M0355]